MQRTFLSPQGEDDGHKCTGRIIGDWIIFTCEKCPEYQRSVNWRTREVAVRKSDYEVSHAGFYFPDGENQTPLFENLN